MHEEAVKGLHSKLLFHQLLQRGHGVREMKPEQIWGEGKWESQGNLLSANFSKWMVYLEKVFLQTFLVLELFQAFIVGPSKDAFPSLEEVVIAWHTQRQHWDIHSLNKKRDYQIMHQQRNEDY